MQTRVQTFLQKNSTYSRFAELYNPDRTTELLNRNSVYNLVTNPDFPSISTIRLAYGDANVSTLLQMHLFRLCQACGITSTAIGVDEIASDIMEGYGDLKLTEVILALKMIRQGKFREHAGDRNRGEFYGSLSSSVICDCLNRYRFEHHNRIITEYEQEQKRIADQQHDAQIASYPHRRLIIFTSVLTEEPKKMIWKFKNLKIFLEPTDMATLEYYAQEREHLNLMYKYTQRLVHEIDEYNHDHPDATLPELPTLSHIRHGIDVINQKFPYDPEKFKQFIQQNK